MLGAMCSHSLGPHESDNHLGNAASRPIWPKGHSAMNPPLVSILIPCHNAAPWIAATLESALAQTWANKEIIVVDDGSGDGSSAIIDTYTSYGVRLVHQEKRGAAAARNHSLRHAQGEFIQFLDADDLLAPDKVEQQVRILDNSSSRVAAGPWGRFYDDPVAAVFTPEANWRDSAPIDWLILNFAGLGMMPPSAWLTPRRLIDKAGPWDERLTLNDDGEYFCRVLLASTGVAFCTNARSFYRSNLSNSLSRRRTEAAWRSAFLSHELCAQHLMASEDSPQTRKACADLFQRLAFAAYPDCPYLVSQCEAKVSSFGGSNQRPGGGIGFQIVARIFGWKLAQRLRAVAKSQTENVPLP
jgi:glycosyltransferase involved in cell wall biosynthesis